MLRLYRKYCRDLPRIHIHELWEDLDNNTRVAAEGGDSRLYNQGVALPHPAIVERIGCNPELVSGHLSIATAACFFGKLLCPPGQISQPPTSGEFRVSCRQESSGKPTMSNWHTGGFQASKEPRCAHFYKSTWVPRSKLKS